MSIVLQGSTSGSITLQEPAVAGSTVLDLPASSGNVVVDSATQTLTNKTIQGGQWTSPSGSTITSGTAVASTSGTSIDFTGIPSWVKRVTVMFNGVSTNGTSNFICRVGNGSIVTSGYASGASRVGLASTGATSTAGYLLSPDNGGTVIAHGQVVITNISGNSWVASFVLGRSDDGYTFLGGGSVTLSGALDRVRITTVNGTDTFDAGTINILYE